MKDLPHHMKKLNRRILRSAHREEMEEEAFETLPSPPRKQTQREMKKIAKRKVAKERWDRAPTPLSPDEKNKKMKYRTPVFDRLNNAKPKATRPSKKKTPRI